MRSFQTELFSRFLPSTNAGHVSGSCHNGKMAALLNSLFFVFKNSFLPITSPPLAMTGEHGKRHSTVSFSMVQWDIMQLVCVAAFWLHVSFQLPLLTRLKTYKHVVVFVSDLIVAIHCTL